jgi:hypothetical protein
MKTKSYLVTVLGILCFLGWQNSFAQEETPQNVFNPMLRDINRIWVSVGEPYTSVSDVRWEGIRSDVVNKLRDMDSRLYIDGSSLMASTGISQLKITIELLSVTNGREPIYKVQTSLLSSILVTARPPYVNQTEVWTMAVTISPATQAQEFDALHDTAMKEIALFSRDYLVANPVNTEKTQSKAKDPNAVTTTVSQKNTNNKQAATAENKNGKTALNTQYKYVSSKNSNLFHLATCSAAARILPENLVGYNTREEAINKGKSPCKRCKP